MFPFPVESFIQHCSLLSNLYITLELVTMDWLIYTRKSEDIASDFPDHLTGLANVTGYRCLDYFTVSVAALELSPLPYLSVITQRY